MKLFALVVVISAGLVTFALSYLFAGVKDISTAAWGTSDARTSIIQTFINVVIATIGYGIFGMVLGLLFRSPISAISIGVIWTLIIEGLLSVFVDSLTKFFPGQLLAVVAQGGSEDISYKYALFTSYGFLLGGMLIVAFLREIAVVIMHL